MNPSDSTRPPRPRLILVTLFRYPLAEHEALNNIFPAMLLRLKEVADVHHFSYRSALPHRLRATPGLFFHEFPIGIQRGRTLDKWLKTLLWYALALHIGWWARRNRATYLYVEESITFLPLLLKLVSGRPVVISGADIFWDVYLGHGTASRAIRRFLERLEAFTWRRLHGLITRTQAMKDYLVSLGVAADRVAVVPEACDPGFYYPMDRATARREWGLTDHDLVIVHHGILHPNKALDRAFEFLQPVLPAHPGLKLWIAGDGPLRRYLERRATELGLTDRVRFLGWLPDVRALNSLLNAADISLVMRRGSFSDHFQVTANLLHSLACGCAILAVRLKGISENVQDGISGLLFDPESAEEFRRQLERLLREPGLRQKLREGAARAARERLDPARVTESWALALIHFIGQGEKTA